MGQVSAFFLLDQDRIDIDLLSATADILDCDSVRLCIGVFMAIGVLPGLRRIIGIDRGHHDAIHPDLERAT